MIVTLITLFAWACIVLYIIGLHRVAPGRKYKSGTGWCIWRWTDVDSEYILRLHIVKTPWFAVCLHWIRKPDAEPWLHDHPVTFLSLILRGGYAELRQTMGETTPRIAIHRWFNFIRASEHDRHRIMLTRKNTLTLCFMGPKTREWGFHIRPSLEYDNPGGWVYWKDYYARKRAGEAPFSKESWAVGFKKLDDKVDEMTASFLAQNNAKIWFDEETRRISSIAGDFDDEAPTSPQKKEG